MNNLKHFRIKSKLTQEELAKKVEITRPYLTEIENGKRNPTIKIAKKIADILGVTVDKIFFDEIVN